MFDMLRVQCRLPDPPVGFDLKEEVFQSKDLNVQPQSDTYTIEPDGSLWLTYSYSLKACHVAYPFDGDVDFYTSIGKSVKDPDYVWLEYRATFEKGKMISIRRLYDAG